MFLHWLAVTLCFIVLVPDEVPNDGHILAPMEDDDDDDEDEDEDEDEDKDHDDDDDDDEDEDGDEPKY